MNGWMHKQNAVDWAANELCSRLCFESRQHVADGSRLHLSERHLQIGAVEPVLAAQNGATHGLLQEAAQRRVIRRGTTGGGGGGGRIG